MFSLDFNHVQSIMRKSDDQRYGPVIGYSYFNQVVRIDVFGSLWVVYTGTNNEQLPEHFSDSFKESYKALQEYTKKNRLRIVTGVIIEDNKRVS